MWVCVLPSRQQFQMVLCRVRGYISIIANTKYKWMEIVLCSTGWDATKVISFRLVELLWEICIECARVHFSWYIYSISIELSVIFGRSVQRFRLSLLPGVFICPSGALANDMAVAGGKWNTEIFCKIGCSQLDGVFLDMDSLKIIHGESIYHLSDISLLEQQLASEQQNGFPL